MDLIAGLSFRQRNVGTRNLIIYIVDKPQNPEYSGLDSIQNSRLLHSSITIFVRGTTCPPKVDLPQAENDILSLFYYL